jgi:DNA recombination protein RmuC
MIIRLPGNKSIIVDAKAPMSHYLESTSAKTSDEYQSHIKEHARVLAMHIKALSDKKYWSYQDHAVELTVLFLPGEAFLSTALQGDPNLLELAAQKNIMLATPILCIALLKSIAQGWRQDLFSQKTHRIIAMTQELSARLEKFQGHFLTIGKTLKNGQLAYHAALRVFQESISPMVQQLGSIVPENIVPENQESATDGSIHRASELLDDAILGEDLLMPDAPHVVGDASDDLGGAGDVEIVESVTLGGILVGQSDAMTQARLD